MTLCHCDLHHQVPVCGHYKWVILVITFPTKLSYSENQILPCSVKMSFFQTIYVCKHLEISSIISIKSMENSYDLSNQVD
jgi:hypothetical protein